MVSTGGTSAGIAVASASAAVVASTAGAPVGAFAAASEGRLALRWQCRRRDGQTEQEDYDAGGGHRHAAHVWYDSVFDGSGHLTADTQPRSRVI